MTQARESDPKQHLKQQLHNLHGRTQPITDAHLKAAVMEAYLNGLEGRELTTLIRILHGLDE